MIFSLFPFPLVFFFFLFIQDTSTNNPDEIQNPQSLSTSSPLLTALEKGGAGGSAKGKGKGKRKGKGKIVDG